MSGGGPYNNFRISFKDGEFFRCGILAFYIVVNHQFCKYMSFFLLDLALLRMKLLRAGGPILRIKLRMVNGYWVRESVLTPNIRVPIPMKICDRRSLLLNVVCICYFLRIGIYNLKNPRLFGRRVSKEAYLL
jgi:hypothetical protein